ncbi:MAG TPA: DEAD/DEAH box helicase [Gammaproteobacteria bacterium]|nr:DEAD/DEAH box helicase [Gammaproteobacteria bacterium]
MTAPKKDTSNTPRFADLGLHPDVLKAVESVGYETPSPIQAQTIPPLLEGYDVLGQAQTGTGKTAAFALPLLSRLDLKNRATQVLVLAPTRELAIQVAEAFQRYAAHLKGFNVLPIYGGQAYQGQLQQLKRGAHVVVGTPGRVMDHMRRGTLKLGSLQCLVLDEADEMLRMGFIDDVEWILEQTPSQRQIALFSATMPTAIKRIAQKHLTEPQEIRIKASTSTASTIRQRYWLVSGTHKLDALTRILEAETFDGIIVFVRTKTATLELADKLEARGFATSALNGDIAQNQRERTVQQLKNGKLDILVATDVAARGLDVDRISHIINYDIPYDTEAYVHRIGRTGRAGRTGEAILFVAPREQRMLRMIERATRQPITAMQLPTTEIINDKRVARFTQNITDTLAAGDLTFYQELMESYQQEHDVPAIEVAAALAKLVQGDTPLLLKPRPEPKQREARPASDFSERRGQGKPPRRNKRDRNKPEAGMETWRLEVGKNHGAMPKNIVGAIANEGGIDSQYIGRINLFNDYSTVDLPEGMPKAVANDLKKARVAGRPLNLSLMSEHAAVKPEKRPGKPKKPKNKDKKNKRLRKS